MYVYIYIYIYKYKYYFNNLKVTCKCPTIKREIFYINTLEDHTATRKKKRFPYRNYEQK